MSRCLTLSAEYFIHRLCCVPLLGCRVEAKQPLLLDVGALTPGDTPCFLYVPLLSAPSICATAGLLESKREFRGVIQVSGGPR